MVNLVSLLIYVKSQLLEAKILFMERAHLLLCNTSEKTANEAKQAHPVHK